MPDVDRLLALGEHAHGVGAQDDEAGQRVEQTVAQRALGQPVRILEKVAVTLHVERQAAAPLEQQPDQPAGEGVLCGHHVGGMLAVQARRQAVGGPGEQRRARVGRVDGQILGELLRRFGLAGRVVGDDGQRPDAPRIFQVPRHCVAVRVAQQRIVEADHQDVHTSSRAATVCATSVSQAKRSSPSPVCAANCARVSPPHAWRNASASALVSG